MNKPIQITVCIAALLLGGFSPIQAADEVMQVDEQLIKLDDHANKLPKEAGQWVMVLDTKTGLIWEVKTTDGSIHDMQAGYDWKGANEIFISELNTLKFGGFSDWRMPTTDELRTIRVKGPEPYINADYFPHTSSTSYMSWRKCGSGEIFDERVKFGEIITNKSNRQVRAVRYGGLDQNGKK